MTALSTHILDLTVGKPAGNVDVRLYRRLAQEEPQLVSEMTTDADGRARLLAPGELTAASYRLAFEIGAYFKEAGRDLTEPAFLDTVVIDFSVADPARHHHVPLLVSPYGYSTYRGS